MVKNYAKSRYRHGIPRNITDSEWLTIYKEKQGAHISKKEYLALKNRMMAVVSDQDYISAKKMALPQDAKTIEGSMLAEMQYQFDQALMRGANSSQSLSQFEQYSNDVRLEPKMAATARKENDSQTVRRRAVTIGQSGYLVPTLALGDSLKQLYQEISSLYEFEVDPNDTKRRIPTSASLLRVALRLAKAKGKLSPQATGMTQEAIDIIVKNVSMLIWSDDMTRSGSKKVTVHSIKFLDPQRLLFTDGGSPIVMWYWCDAKDRANFGGLKVVALNKFIRLQVRVNKVIIDFTTPQSKIFILGDNLDLWTSTKCTRTFRCLRCRIKDGKWREVFSQEQSLLDIATDAVNTIYKAHAYIHRDGCRITSLNGLKKIMQEIANEAHYGHYDIPEWCDASIESLLFLDRACYLLPVMHSVGDLTCAVLTAAFRSREFLKPLKGHTHTEMIARLHLNFESICFSPLKKFPHLFTGNKKLTLDVIRTRRLAAAWRSLFFGVSVHRIVTITLKLCSQVNFLAYSKHESMANEAHQNELQSCIMLLVLCLERIKQNAFKNQKLHSLAAHITDMLLDLSPLPLILGSEEPFEKSLKKLADILRNRTVAALDDNEQRTAVFAVISTLMENTNPRSQTNIQAFNTQETFAHKIIRPCLYKYSQSVNELFIKQLEYRSQHSILRQNTYYNVQTKDVMLFSMLNSRNDVMYPCGCQEPHALQAVENFTEFPFPHGWQDMFRIKLQQASVVFPPNSSPSSAAL